MSATKTTASVAPLWRRFVVQAVFLYAVWLLLSGHYDLFHLVLGAISVGLVLLMNRTILPFVSLEGSESGRLRISRYVLYIPWLAWEMILAGTHVARVVLSPRMEIRPALIRFKSRQPNNLARVILGNSITLTPGTLTIELDGDEFLVHALTEETARGLLNGSM
jgi:multicomponent Na+:H+ antiporter subunit E